MPTPTRHYYKVQAHVEKRETDRRREARKANAQYKTRTPTAHKHAPSLLCLDTSLAFGLFAVFISR